MIQYHINNDNFKTTTGFHWYTDGNDNKFSKECPSGYKKGRLNIKKAINNYIERKKYDRQRRH